MRGARWTRAAFAAPADVVARSLLGAVLEVAPRGGVGRPVRRGRIVETEAYLGEADAACHAARGRTARTEPMYGPPGTVYVYLIYGLHHLLNLVAAEVGDPHAVLIRAIEPLDGPPAATAREARARSAGPGRVGRWLDVDRRDDRSDVVTGRVAVRDGTPPARVAVGPRVGVAYAGAWADAPLRFGDADSALLSRPFPAAPT